MKHEQLTPPVIKTERLTLRPLQTSDAGLIALYAGDVRVAENLAIVPHPYPPGAAEAYIERTLEGDDAEVVWAIDLDNELIGVISINPQKTGRGNIGYWLAPQLWGAGYTPEALEAVVKFAKSMGVVGLNATVHQDNPQSSRVLIKEGFEYCGDSDTHSVSRNGMVRSWNYKLDFEHETAHNLNIQTERLRIAPFEAADAEAFSELMNDEAVTDMMRMIPAPFGPEQAADWISKWSFKGEIGFALKISLQDGTLIGFAALNGDPVYTAYALGKRFRGQGYVTEAMTAFLENVMKTFALDEITAGVFIDNLASQRVLEKLGFELNGQKMHKTTSRLEEAPLILYRLRRSHPLGKNT